MRPIGMTIYPLLQRRLCVALVMVLGLLVGAPHAFAESYDFRGTEIRFTLPEEFRRAVRCQTRFDGYDKAGGATIARGLWIRRSLWGGEIPTGILLCSLTEVPGPLKETQSLEKWTEYYVAALAKTGGEISARLVRRGGRDWIEVRDYWNHRSRLVHVSLFTPVGDDAVLVVGLRAFDDDAPRDWVPRLEPALMEFVDSIVIEDEKK